MCLSLIITYDNESFPRTCNCYINLILICDEAEIAVHPASGGVFLYLRFRQGPHSGKHYVVPFTTCVASKYMIDFLLTIIAIKIYQVCTKLIYLYTNYGIYVLSANSIPLYQIQRPVLVKLKLSKG